MAWTSKFFLLCNIALSLVTIFCYFSPDIEPSTIWMFSFLALLYPILILLHLGFIVYWLFSDMKYVFISLFTIALGYNHISSYFGFRGSKISNDGHEVSIISYNISNAAAAYDKEKNAKEDKVKKLEEFLSRFQDEDIICLQEVGSYATDVLKRPFAKYNMHKFDKGAIILTKHRIIKKGMIEFGTKTNSCLWADIIVDLDTLRIYNLHLQSNKISKDADDLATNKDINKDEAFSKIRRILRRYRQYHITRSKQALMVKEHADLSPHRVIIAGDFNDIPLSHNYKILQKNLKDTFRESGVGSGSTFNGKIPFLRIDYILVDPSFKVSKFNIIKENFSDHYPIATVLSLKQKAIEFEDNDGNKEAENDPSL